MRTIFYRWSYFNYFKIKLTIFHDLFHTAFVVDEVVADLVLGFRRDRVGPDVGRPPPGAGGGDDHVLARSTRVTATDVAAKAGDRAGQEQGQAGQRHQEQEEGVERRNHGEEMMRLVPTVIAFLDSPSCQSHCSIGYIFFKAAEAEKTH